MYSCRCVLRVPCSSRQFLVKEASTNRKFHASRTNRDLVAPPDPISHMRPIIYDTPAAVSQPAYLRHPYSLAEFGADADSGDHELQFRLLRQQLDTLHQNFWLDVRLLYLLPFFFSAKLKSL